MTSRTSTSDYSKATSQTATAPRDRDRALQALRSASDQQWQRDHHRAVVADIDEALEPRIRQAAAAPASYVDQALGPRPTGDARRWDRAATAIERYRHGVLGLEPADGPAGRRDPAIGPRPTTLRDVAAWDHARRTVEQSRTGLERLVKRL